MINLLIVSICYILPTFISLFLTYHEFIRPEHEITMIDAVAIFVLSLISFMPLVNTIWLLVTLCSHPYCDIIVWRKNV